MTIAGFESIPPVTVTRHRFAAGTFVNGTYVVGADTPVDVESVIHPVTAKTKLSARMLREIDLQRNTDWIVLYSALDTYQQGDEATQTKGDRVEYQGFFWEIMAVDQWLAGVLDHQKAIAAKVQPRADD